MASMNPRGMESELYAASLRGSFEKVSRITNWNDQETPTKNNVLHLHVGIHLHEKNGMVSVEFIQHVLNNDGGYPLLWKENSSGNTPLHLAARFGHKNAVQVFLERAGEVSQEEVTKLLKVTNNKNDTALHEAARAGHAQVVKLLVEVEPSCLHHEPNQESETPLYLAAERGCATSVLSILATCSSSALAYDGKGPCGRTALHAAVQWGDPEMVQELLEKDRSVMSIKNDEGLTPLHFAAGEINELEHLKILLSYDKEEKDSSAVYIQDNMGRTALHIAMMRRNWEAVESLIESRPDCIEIVDNKGQNVLHYAAKWTCFKVLNGLLRRGHLDKLINDKDDEGNTPLHVLAASIPHTPDSHFCADNLPYLVKNNPSLDVKAFNKQNLTAGDVLASFYGLLRQEHRISTYEEDIDDEKASTGTRFNEWNIGSIKKAAESRLVVAALIATVSFTAGFTVPGGFDQNSGANMGMAVLKRKPAFVVFLVSDAIAFTFSTLAILCYFMLASTDVKRAIQYLSLCSLIISTISLGALMIAFVAGVSVVLSKSPVLIISIYAISGAFFYGYFCLIERSFPAARFWRGRFHLMNQQLL
ncbi:Ankyrin repeat-containing protein NPR4 [Bienertia sinuspersici]